MKLLSAAFILVIAALPAVGKTVPAPMAAEDLCQRYEWACETKPGKRFESFLELNYVNNLGNKTRQISDQRQYGKQDYWALPTARGGDCEDIALLKMLMLTQLGFDSTLMVLATATTTSNEAHAVLLVTVA